ncbi:MAG: hypothetical protein AVO33_10815 [delta proteobacterium ML8_F1]|nr:MAG: hypothetical protein AVO33_10815 [delta proteobacterium ML8_F1]
MGYLDMINEPKDLKKFSLEELSMIASELRDFLLQEVSRTGGHLAPNLGTVELTVALHYVFDSPVDKIIWDVGHQAYSHKILTGRKDRFNTLRQSGGLSGFLKRSESVHDIFEAGHSSTSISAALGISYADSFKDGSHYVVPVIGDGALTAGIAFEALNFAGEAKSPLIIILNDNEMSISPNVGSVSNTLSRVRSFKGYNRLKHATVTSLGKSKLGGMTYKVLAKAKSSLKELVIPGMFFEHFGLSYIGPVDGHDLRDLITAMGIAKKMDKPVLLHVRTIKGKGYPYAQLNPDLYHGVGPFDLRYGVQPRVPQDFSSVLGQTLIRMARDHENLYALTAAMTSGTGLRNFALEFPERCVDVGIAEQNAVTMAAGMATAGLKPYVVIYSTFLQRAFDQLIHDVALQNLDVVVCIDRSGIVGEDGETHHGVFDTGYLNLIPNFKVFAPKDARELQRILSESYLMTGPVAIKYPRGKAYELLEDNTPLSEPELLKTGDHTLIITYSRMVKTALEVHKLCEEPIGVLSVRQIKPLNMEALLARARGYDRIILLEEAPYQGGINQLIETALLREGSFEVTTINLPQDFVPHGGTDLLLEKYGLDPRGILKVIKEGTVKG